MARIIFDEDKNKLVAEIYHTGYKDGVAAAKPSVKETCEDAVSRQSVKEQMIYYGFHAPDMTVTEFVEDCLPSVNPQKTKTGILDEIRSEIKETKNNLLFNMVSKDIILEVIIDIIDKYKAESGD